MMPALGGVVAPCGVLGGPYGGLGLSPRLRGLSPRIQALSPRVLSPRVLTPGVRVLSPRARVLSPRARLRSRSPVDATVVVIPRLSRSRSMGSPPLLPDGTKLLLTVYSTEIAMQPAPPVLHVSARYAGMEAKGGSPDPTGRVLESFEFPYCPSHGLSLRVVDPARRVEGPMAETRMLDVERLLGRGSEGEWFGELDLYCGEDACEGDQDGVYGKLTVSIQLTTPREVMIDRPTRYRKIYGHPRYVETPVPTMDYSGVAGTYGERVINPYAYTCY